ASKLFASSRKSSICVTSASFLSSGELILGEDRLESKNPTQIIQIKNVVIKSLFLLDTKLNFLFLNENIDNFYLYFDKFFIRF
ncbi:MAG: hypothetical protein KAH01_02360, partial [Caldisericia bacterium]|nr:hypothetical protein [Caldisericia bacterium]